MYTHKITCSVKGGGTVLGLACGLGMGRVHQVTYTFRDKGPGPQGGAFSDVAKQNTEGIPPAFLVSYNS